ncbi:hypothetical protein BDC45DRAFT_541715 [Circinella umbellata]|nr:hypothetical protein BDC45DRAFT_542306 [Circinella umbellata]KAI7847685.1 hypothetical protein BDC45DRAFT_541715 [Circinella umbellata]
MSQSNDLSIQLFTTFITAMNESKALAVDESLKQQTLICNLQATINERLEQIENRVSIIQDSLTEMRMDLEEITSEKNAVMFENLPHYPRANTDDNTLLNVEFSRDVQHPVNAKGSPQQFSWELYDTIGQKVLKQQWRNSYLRTFKKNVVPFADTLAMNMRAKYDLEATTTWSDLNHMQQRQAMLLSEESVKDEFPLRACEGNWGARLLMVHAFQRTKKEQLRLKDIDQDEVASSYDAGVDCDAHDQAVESNEPVETIGYLGLLEDEKLCESLYCFDDEDDRLPKASHGHNDDYGYKQLDLDADLTSDDDDDECLPLMLNRQTKKGKKVLFAPLAAPQSRSTIQTSDHKQLPSNMENSRTSTSQQVAAPHEIQSMLSDVQNRRSMSATRMSDSLKVTAPKSTRVNGSQRDNHAQPARKRGRPRKNVTLLAQD